MQLKRFCLSGALLLVASPAFAGPASSPKKAANVTAQAFANVSAITPGGTVRVLVSLSPDKDWHIYWKSPGGLSGLPTTIAWSLPPGFKSGAVAYPAPTLKHDKMLNEDSFVLVGRSLFPMDVSVPADVRPGDDATFSVKIDWLACKKECIPGDVELSLSLPIVAPGKAPAPANKELFEQADSALPVPASKAEHVKISARLDQASLKPGDKFNALVVAAIEARHHMQSNKPLQEGLIPAVVFPESADGLELMPVEYPPATVREDKLLGKLSEYGGTVEFKIPARLSEGVARQPRSLRGVIQYQICNDSGTCYPPQAVQFDVSLPVEGAAAAQQSSAPSQAIPALSSAGVEAAARTNAPASNPFVRFQDWLLSFGFAGALLVALLGGFILNLMPCVLPVISLKMLSFVRQSHEHRARVFWLGITYSAGILVFFAVFAAIYFFTNREFSWGEQFQRPRVVIGLAAIVTAFSLSLFGVWAVFTPRVISQLGQKAEGEGFLSAFGTGVLATLLGTACTAPFLSAAIGAASKFSAIQGAQIFIAVGVGMAFPFIVLAANPAWLRFVPKAGPWMLTFEYLMGFLLLGTVIWLINPLRNQIGAEGLMLSLIFLLAVAIAAWVKGRIQFGDSTRRKAAFYSLSILVLILGWLLPFRVLSTIDGLMASQIRTQDLITLGQVFERTGGGHVEQISANLDWSAGIPWQRYKRQLALGDVRSGNTVFVDYTADWCANCKTMLKTAIERPETIRVMRELGVIPYTADYTSPVPEIKEDLARFKRGGVPVFVVYRPNDPDNPEILPEIITSQTLIDALRRAGPSRGPANQVATAPPAKTLSAER